MANPWGFLGLPQIQEFLVVKFVLWGKSRPGDKLPLQPAANVTFVSLSSAIHQTAWIALYESFSAHQFSGESAARDFKVSILKGIFNLIFQAFGSFAEIPNLM